MSAEYNVLKINENEFQIDPTDYMFLARCEDAEGAYIKTLTKIGIGMEKGKIKTSDGFRQMFENARAYVNGVLGTYDAEGALQDDPFEVLMAGSTSAEAALLLQANVEAGIVEAMQKRTERVAQILTDYGKRGGNQ